MRDSTTASLGRRSSRPDRSIEGRGQPDPLRPFERDGDCRDDGRHGEDGRDGDGSSIGVGGGLGVPCGGMGVPSGGVGDGLSP